MEAARVSPIPGWISHIIFKCLARVFRIRRGPNLLEDPVNIRGPRNPSGYSRDIAVEPVTYLAENREGQVSFTALDSAKIGPVQPTLLSKTLLAQTQDLAFVLNPAAEP
jgi:hypothetical protein